MNNKLNLIASVGLALGGLLGMAGSMVSGPELRQLFWTIDGVGLVVAGVLLSIKYFRTKQDYVAAGFLVFALAECIIMSSNGPDLMATLPAFAAGIVLWATALLMTSIPNVFSWWIRLLGTIAAILFIITAVRIMWGEPLVATQSPLPGFAYPVFVLTIAGWIWTLLSEKTP